MQVLPPTVTVNHLHYRRQYKTYNETQIPEINMCVHKQRTVNVLTEDLNATHTWPRHIFLLSESKKKSEKP